MADEKRHIGKTVTAIAEPGTDTTAPDKVGKTTMSVASRFDPKSRRVKRHDIRSGKRNMESMRTGIGSYPSNRNRSVGFVSGRGRIDKPARLGLTGGLAIGSGFPSVGARPMTAQSTSTMGAFMRPFVNRLRPMFAQRHRYEGDDGKTALGSGRGVSADVKRGGGRRHKKEKKTSKKRKKREEEEKLEEEEEEMERGGKRRRRGKRRRGGGGGRGAAKKLLAAKGDISDALERAGKGSRPRKRRSGGGGGGGKGRGKKVKLGGGQDTTLDSDSDFSDAADGGRKDSKRKKKKDEVTVRTKTGAIAGANGPTSGCMTVKTMPVQPQINVPGFTMSSPSRKTSFRLI